MGHKVRPPQGLDVLIALQDNYSTIEGIAGATGTSPASVSQKLIRLRRKGWVKRENPKAKGRGAIAKFALTKKGITKIPLPVSA